MTTTSKDIGDYLEVPEAEREDVDPPAQYNSDAGFDVEVVPDGIVVDLGADDEPDELLPEEIVKFGLEDVGDGTPLHFVTPADPKHESEDI